MPVSPELIQTLLQKMKEKTISRREMVLLQLYLSSPDADKALDELDFLAIPEAADQPGQTQEYRNRQILQHISQRPRRTAAMIRWAASAAAFLLLAAGAFLYRANNTVSKQQLVYRTGKGEIKKIILPDSTVVWLNAGTVFSYPEVFDGEIRKVHLQQGQAFFEVTPDPQQNFTVESGGGLQTQVLGTSFLVITDSITANTQVTVKTGKVAVVQQGKNLAALLPGDQLHYDMRLGKFALSRVTPEAIGEVMLERIDFAGMASAMQQLYGLKVVAGNSAVSHNRYSLRLRYNADPKQLLDVISAINGNHWQHHKTDSTTVTIY